MYYGKGLKKALQGVRAIRIGDSSIYTDFDDKESQTRFLEEQEAKLQEVALLNQSIDFNLPLTAPLKPADFSKTAYTGKEQQIVTGIGHREEGEKMEMQWVPVTSARPSDMFGKAIGLGMDSGVIKKVQLGGTITQHPEKQGFERGVTSAGFPTQEQMTGLGFRQGPASYKPQKYQEGVTGEGVQQEIPPQQNVEVPPQQLTEAPPQSATEQQMGNIGTAQKAGLSMQPKEIAQPQAQPEQQAADDVKMKVPEGSFVLNYKAVNLAGEDYIRKMVEDAMKIAARNGVNIAVTKGTKGKEAVDILISNGEFIIPPELVGIIGERQLKLINDRGIAAMKKEEQLEQSIYKGKDSKVGQYGGAETPPPPQQAYGGFIDMKEGYASGGKIPFDPEGKGYDHNLAERVGNPGGPSPVDFAGDKTRRFNRAIERHGSSAVGFGQLIESGVISEKDLKKYNLPLYGSILLKGRNHPTINKELNSIKGKYNYRKVDTPIGSRYVAFPIKRQKVQ